MRCDLCAPTIPPKEGSCLVQCSADAVLKFLTRGPTYDVSCLVCVQLVGLKKKRFELCLGTLSHLCRAFPTPMLYLFFSYSHFIAVPTPSLPFVPSLVFLESAGRRQWPKRMGETCRGGKRILANEVFPSDPHLVSSTHGPANASRGPSCSPLQTTPQALVCEDGISRRTGSSWPMELRGGPRAGLVHNKEIGGF